MRYLLLGLLLVGCNNCPTDEYRNYVYGDKALITGGFYKGFKGSLRGRSRNYERGCMIPSFKVKISTELLIPNVTVDIGQYMLYVESPTTNGSNNGK